jgi:dTDP-4-dehydrorhamnose 3,5-epimerase
MGNLSLQKIITSPLKRIELDDGNVLHALRNNDFGYDNFGEAYFSFIKQNKVKGWKCHTKMTMNLIVPVGDVKFVFYYDNEFKDIEIGDNNYCRITVPPNIWFGFKGMGENNLVLNIANLRHDPEEVQRKKITEINFNWD